VIKKEKLNQIVSQIDVELAASQVVEWIINNVHTFIDNHSTEFVIGFSSIDADGVSELEKVEKAFLEMDIDVSEGGIDIDLFSKFRENLSEEDIEKATAIIDAYEKGLIVSSDDIETINNLLSSFNPDEDMEGLSQEDEERVEAESENLEILYNVVDEIKSHVVENKDYLERIFNSMIYYYELCGFRQGKEVKRNLDGFVKIDEFCYYPYSLPVTSTAKIPRLDDDGNPVLDDNGNIIVDIGESVVKRDPPQFHIDISIQFWEAKPQMSMF
jgi:hypothetical protein